MKYDVNDYRNNVMVKDDNYQNNNNNDNNHYDVICSI